MLEESQVAGWGGCPFENDFGVRWSKTMKFVTTHQLQLLWSPKSWASGDFPLIRDGFGNRTKTEKSYWLPQVQQNVGAHLNLESVLDVSRSKKSVDKSKNDEISSPCLVAVRGMNNYSYPPRKTNMAMENHPSLVGDTVHLQIIRGFSMAMLVHQRSAGINFGSSKLCTEWFAKFGWRSPSFKVGDSGWAHFSGDFFHVNQSLVFQGCTLPKTNMAMEKPPSFSNVMLVFRGILIIYIYRYPGHLSI